MRAACRPPRANGFVAGGGGGGGGAGGLRAAGGEGFGGGGEALRGGEEAALPLVKQKAWVGLSRSGTLRAQTREGGLPCDPPLCPHQSRWPDLRRGLHGGPESSHG